MQVTKSALITYQDGTGISSDMNEQLHKIYIYISTTLWYQFSSFVLADTLQGNEGSDGHHPFELANLWGEPKGKTATAFEGFH